ncbi:ATP-dependent RNA helicase DOB1 [Nematocida sp. AWRm80]|nr:ATP-dependent RNA helicase DOB1 [Nematocida sp. AWRm80]
MNVIETEALPEMSLPEKSREMIDLGVEIDSFTEKKDNRNIVRHTCILPRGMSYIPVRETSHPIRCKYPFVLDRFQELALECLERDESVLVSAHTSAGKTLIAEYAIHLSIQRKQRVIYTSPIKALSNQKYRELNEKFGDVGLMTGDVTLNPDSTCIVMTTEILRNMIYKGTEILRETHFVVFDEVHYMRDRERGVVWEESIILLPSTIRFIFLSATIPNAEEFVRWIVSIHRQPCHVIYTEKRPTPLEHYIYSNRPKGVSLVHKSNNLQNVCSRLALIVDKEGSFLSKNFFKVGSSTTRGQNGRRREAINVIEILEILKRTNNLPAIIFSFRRKECEDYALMSLKEFDFNTEEEKELIETIFTNALNSLREDDRKLKQIVGIKNLLKRGIGVHHSGLLPIVKEIIEILFQENLLKVLFATETFSIGLNMPAKAVVFTSIKKFDGITTRFITSGEYIQMSGRAGRRDTDKIGNVILALESTQSIDESQIKKVLHGASNSLDSAFKLTYNTILNILRLDGMDEEYIIKHSFLQFRQEMKGNEISQEISRQTAILDDIQSKYSEGLSKISSSEEIQRYFNLKYSLLDSPKALFPSGIHKTLLNPGRIIQIQKTTTTEYNQNGIQFQYNHVLSKIEEVLGIIVADTKGQKKPSTGTKSITVETETQSVLEIPIESITRISKYSIDLSHYTTPAKYFQNKKRRKTASEHSIGFYTPAELGYPNESEDNLQKIKECIKTIEDTTINNLSPEDKQAFHALADLFSLQKYLKEKISQLSDDKVATELIMIEEYRSKKKILKALSYISETEVLIKGKVASEISSGDELILTEMLFNNEFSKLTPERICSLLSCVVFDEKLDRIPLSPELEAAFKILQSTMTRLAQEFHRLDSTFNEKEYLERCNPNLMGVVYNWALGDSFAQICESTEVFEGSVIRCFRRLEEVLKEMCRASKVIGNVEMENKFSAAISLVKRDIVFANSLYL